jgi:NitT/TauT family transport system substrate-binding protein
MRTIQPPTWCIRLLALALAAAIAVGHGVARADSTLRIGVLKFGTVSWVMDVIQHHELDESYGIDIDELELASNQATLVALQAGRVDCVVADWLWVSRQRASGADWTFIPFSADLRNRRLGVAGSPIDKSWIILQALAQEQHIDLAHDAQLSFGAPPLLNQELLAGRLDAVLTYWNFAAPLESRGLPVVLSMSDALRQLGFKTPIPLVGYVVSERWAREHPRELASFVSATQQADSILASSDAEWKWLGPKTGARNPAELKALRDAFRAGIPAHWGKEERREAQALYAVFAKAGGQALVGPAKTLQSGTFLDTVSY